MPEPAQENDGDDELHLGDIFPEPARPPSPEPTIAIYQRQQVSPPDRHVGRWNRLTIRLVGSHPLWGHYLWNSGRCLATYLDHNTALYRDKCVIELGAGGGLPGLVTALNGARKTVLTDYPDAALVANLSQNVETNTPADIRARVDVLGYVWGADVRPLLSTLRSSSSSYFDLILLSDLVFNHSQHGALIKTCELLTDPNPQHDRPCALVFYTHHRPHLAERDLDFLRLAESRGWYCEEFFTEKQEPMFADDPGDVVVRSMVHGWALRRRK